MVYWGLLVVVLVTWCAVMECAWPKLARVCAAVVLAVVAYVVAGAEHALSVVVLTALVCAWWSVAGLAQWSANVRRRR